MQLYSTCIHIGHMWLCTRVVRVRSTSTGANRAKSNLILWVAKLCQITEVVGLWSDRLLAYHNLVTCCSCFCTCGEVFPYLSSLEQMYTLYKASNVNILKYVVVPTSLLQLFLSP